MREFFRDGKPVKVFMKRNHRLPEDGASWSFFLIGDNWWLERHISVPGCPERRTLGYCRKKCSHKLVFMWQPTGRPVRLTHHVICKHEKAIDEAKTEAA